jgi:hypothetical protein
MKRVLSLFRRILGMILLPLCSYVSLSAANGVSPEHVARRSNGELVLAHKHFPRNFLFEEHCFFFAMGAHNNFDAGIDRARDPGHAARLSAVRRGDHQHARFVDVRLDEDAGFRGIAEHCRHVLFA